MRPPHAHRRAVLPAASGVLRGNAGGNEVGTNRVLTWPLVSAHVTSRNVALQAISDEDWDCVPLGLPPTEPKVRGSNPLGRASSLVRSCLQIGTSLVELMSLADGNTGGNRATAPGDGEVVAPWGLSPRVALGRGVPGRRPSAQGVGGHVPRGARDQAPSRRGGGLRCCRADAAQLRVGVGRSLRRAWRQRRDQRPHAS
jgi:hypothetical protein